MKEWLDDVVPMTLSGQIAVPYSWWVGETGSRFLITLRDKGTIMGSRCPSCGTVYVPPRKNCGGCFKDIDEWVEVGPEGMVVAFTIVRDSYKLDPAATPFAYALIKLDGADVRFLHVITSGLDRLAAGSRVRAKLREQRKGHITDIESFEIIK